MYNNEIDKYYYDKARKVQHKDLNRFMTFLQSNLQFCSERNEILSKILHIITLACVTKKGPAHKKNFFSGLNWYIFSILTPDLQPTT